MCKLERGDLPGDRRSVLIAHMGLGGVQNESLRCDGLFISRTIVHPGTSAEHSKLEKADQLDFPLIVFLRPIAPAQTILNPLDLNDMFPPGALRISGRIASFSKVLNNVVRSEPQPTYRSHIFLFDHEIRLGSVAKDEDHIGWSKAFMRLSPV